MTPPPAGTGNTLQAQKAAMRRTMTLMRGRAARAMPDASLRVRDQVLRGIETGRVPFVAGTIVSFYIDMNDEIDAWPLAAALQDRGAHLCLPVIVAKGEPLIFRSYAPGDALVQGPWQIPQPDERAQEVKPRLLIVPLMAFDRRGGRLGYGGGYYDKSLTLLRFGSGITALGVAHAAQEVPEVPMAPYDARLDIIATDRDLIFS